MTPFDSRSLLSDADPPMPWSYRYSTADECLAVKQEPEWDDGGESEVTSWASLYADHDVKDEIVFGPEQLQPQDIAMSMQHVLIKTEEDPCTLKMADEARTEHVWSPILSGELQTDQTPQQLAYCYVRLERIVVGEQYPSSSNLTDKCFKCKICQRQFSGQGNLTNHIKSHRNNSCHICLRKFLYPCLLSAHMKLHKAKPYCCNLCNKSFAQSSKLIGHMIDHTMPKTYHCNICQGQFKNKKSLSNHKYKNHSDAETKQYSCKICSRRFVYRGSLIAHKMYHHNNDKLNGNSINRLTQQPSSFARIIESNTSFRNIYKKNREERRLRTHNLRLHGTGKLDRGHIKRKPHCCAICQKQFVYRKTLLTHMQSRHPKENEQLIIAQSHDKEKPHCCIVCERRFVYRKTLITHMRRRHPKTEQLANTQSGKEKPHCCTICQRRFVYRTTLLTHMRTRHPKENEQCANVQSYDKVKPHCCTVCQRRFVYKTTLLTHMRTRHPKENEQCANTQSNDKEKPHYCTVCPTRFVYRKTLLTHMRRRHPKENEQLANTQNHENEKPYCCDVCQKRFVYKKTLITHMRKRHRKSKKPDKQLPHDLGLTEEKFHEKANESDNQQITSLSNSTQHEQDQTKEKPHCCSICQKRFVYQKTLITHMAKHLGSKPDTQLTESSSLDKQRHCQKRFVYRKTLLTHMRLRHQKVNESNKQLTHNQNLSEEKPHCCTICQRRFVYRKTLHTHMRMRHPKAKEQFENIQSGTEKPHCCTICQRRFVYRKTLLTHMRMRHLKENEQPLNKQSHDKEKPYCCDICQKRFVYKNTLITHMRKRHQKLKERKKQLGRDLDLTEEKFHDNTNESNNQQITSPSNSTKHGQDQTKEKPHCCSICQKRFVYQKTLITHMEKHSGSKPDKRVPYMQLRHQKLNDSNQQLTHNLESNEEKPHCCEICQRRFVYRKTLITHMRKHPGSKSDTRVIQPFRLAKQKQYLRYKRAHCCKVCQRRFVYRKTLLTHMRLQHQKVIEPNKRLTQNQDLSKDQQVNQSNKQQITPPSNYTKPELDQVQEKRHCCRICQKRFVYKKTLVTHMRRRHPKANEQLPNMQSEKEKQHCCTICQRRFVYRNTLLTHMRRRHPKANEQLANTKRHENENPYCCTICQRSFTRSYKLIGHMRDHKVALPYRCNICQGHFKNKKSLYNHKYSDHSETKKYSCKICPRRFVYKSGLIAHNMYHKKLNENSTNKLTQQPAGFTKLIESNMKQERSFSKIYNKKIVRKQILHTHNVHLHGKDEHKRGHLKGKPHCCSICQKRFVYKKTWVTHMRRRHPKANEQLENKQSGKEKQHCCTICQRQFVYRKTLLTHIRMRHPKANEQLANTQSHANEKPHCCDICQKRFVYEKTLLSHMRIRHQKVNEPNKHLADNPDLSKEQLHEKKNESSNQQITSHSNSAKHDHDQSREKPHCCSICPKRFMYRKTLKIHMRKHPGSKLDTQLTQPGLAKDKQDLNHDKPHCCKICQRRFVYRKTLLTHMRLRHQQKVNELNKQLALNHDLTKEKPHCCEICQRRFVYRKTLLTHMRKHPENKPNVQQTRPFRFAKQRTEQASSVPQVKQGLTQERAHCCNICQRRFVYRKTLLTHMRLQHGKVTESDHQQIVPPFSSTKHEQDHTKEKPHCCRICRKRFVYKKTLVTHMRLQHQKASELNEELSSNFTEHKQHLTEEKRYSCHICQKRFVYEKVLLTHMRQHTENEPNEQLSPPSSIFVNNTDFASNNQTHTQPKLYTCDICEKQFAHKDNLDNHLRLHSAVKPYWCNVCKKRFTELNSLNVHKRIHTTENSLDDSTHSHTVEKPYSCNLCREQFADLDVLIDHARQFHIDEKSFRCKLKNITN